MKKNSFIILFVCLIILLAIQIFIVRKDIWFDEGYSVLYAKQSYSEIMEVNDVHPPGYYIMLRGWISSFGDDDRIMRILSALYGLGCFILLYFIWEKLFEKESFWIFGSLFVAATNILYYFTEIRMYVVALFFCLCSFYSLLMFDKKGFKAMFIISTAILPYLHYFTAFFVLFELSYCLIMKKKETMKSWVVSFIMMVPIFIYFFAQLGRIETLGFQKQSFASVLSTYYYAWFYTWEGAVSQLFTVIGVIFITVAFFLIIKYIDTIENKDEKKISLLMLAWIILPTIFMMMINTFIMNIYHHRFFFFVTWFFILLTARAIDVLRNRKWVKVVAIMMCLFIVANFMDYHISIDKSISKVAGFFNEMACSESDIIVHESQFSNLAHIYYNEQHGCYKNYLFTDLSQKQLNAIGGNVIPEGRILYNEDELKELDKFYYLKISGRLNYSNFKVQSLINVSGAQVLWVESIER